MKTLTVVGAGRVGKTLARLARESGCYQVRDVFCRTRAAADEAVGFIGAGRVVTDLSLLAPADIYLLSVTDTAIADCAQALARARVLQAGSVAFHASGVGEAALLDPLRQQGVRVGSLHPAYSFADPARAVAGFADTLCALEGDGAACVVLEGLALDIGGKPFRLSPGGKAAYHAALVVASNYLVTLADMSSQLAAQAGVPDDVAGVLCGGLMRQTLDNVLALGPYAALTGPIVRGDAGTVALHLQAVREEGLRDAYKVLGRQAVALSGERLDEAACQQLLALLAD